MSEYEWRNENEDLERKQRAVLLDRMRDITTGPESALAKTNGIIQNYNLRKLSSLNKTQTGLVRAARFTNGAFLSFRIAHGESMVQTDFSFERDKRPNVLPWLLRSTSAGLERPTRPMGHAEDHLLRSTLTTLVENALGILELEAQGDNPWIHKYSQVEVSSARNASGITVHETRLVRPDEFKISPKDGEPYL